MRELVKKRQPFEREILDKDEAIRIFEAQNEPFKVELIREKAATPSPATGSATSSTSARDRTSPTPGSSER